MVTATKTSKSKPRSTSTAKKVVRRPALQPLSKFERIVGGARFGRWHMILSLVVLGTASFVWALAAAHLQTTDADRLIGGYVFHDAKTLQGATFPLQRSLLLQWPMFWLQHAFGYTPTGFQIITILGVLATIGGFVYLLWRIERRPQVFGLLCLALASMLLLVPPMPTDETTARLGVQVLVDRNIEYLVYIAGLVFLSGMAKLRSRRGSLALLCLTVVFASDSIFAVISITGAVLAALCYWLVRQQELRQLTRRWLGMSLLATVLAAMLELLGGVAGILRWDSSLKIGSGFELGRVGANLWQGLAYFVGGLVVVVGSACAVTLLKHSFRPQPKLSKKKLLAQRVLAPKLATLLIYSSVASAIAYIGLSRQRTITVPTVGLAAITILLAVASVGRRYALSARRLVLVTAILLLGVGSGLVFLQHSTAQHDAAAAPLRDRNQIVAEALAGHRVETLIGNYWRVLPIKSASGRAQTVSPLEHCTQPRQGMTSHHWLPDLRKSFGYLLTFDTPGNGFTDCTLAKVIAAYGRPNASTVIAGTSEQPKELLLFYDRGIQSKAVAKPVVPKPAEDPTTTTSSSVSLRPVPVASLDRTTCNGGRTILQVVAHEDDDLLFMNPDLLRAIQQGDCVRTIYLTAGDAGSNKFYWLGREQGSEAAYSELAASSDVWNEQTVKLAAHQFATIASPAGQGKLSLVFMHLPDGNPDGRGFANSGFESLAKLQSGETASISSVDGQSTYDYTALIRAVRAFMDIYQPDEVRTQLPYNNSQVYTDHSDHMAAGHYATEAFTTYKTKHPASRLAYYTGYPIREQLPNVEGDELAAKEQAFFTYSQYDGQVCSTHDQCVYRGDYGDYLARQYRTDL